MFDVNIRQFEKYDFTVPSNLSRVVDLLSIKQSKLLGAANTFAENFDKKGFIGSTIWGTNIGDRLDSQTTILTAGSNSVPIVAYERFSGKYRLINTDALSSSNLSFINPTYQTYALSAYNSYWGWGLILPSNFDPATFDQYYHFYSYVAGAEGTVVDAVVNWTDDTNSISRSTLSANWATSCGTMWQLIASTLVSGLQLINPITGEIVPISISSEFTMDDDITFLLLDDSSTILSLGV